MNKLIYADCNGSTPPCAQVRSYLQERLQGKGPFGNPNALHGIGRQLNVGLEKVRQIMAENLGAKAEQLIFTSGATEAINTVFHSLIPTALKEKKKYIVLSSIEHPAVLETAKRYEKEGAHLKLIRVDHAGIIDINELHDFIKKHNDKIALVAVMAANNETGVLQPYESVAEICQKETVPFLCDTTQLIGKNYFHFEKSKVDFAIMSAHKIGGITGAGVLIAKDPTQIIPLLTGGGQEKNHRSGTQNYLAIEAMAVAVQSSTEEMPKGFVLEKSKLEFENKMKHQFKKIMIVGEQSPRLPGTTALCYPGVHGQAVQIELESRNIFVTTSSACSDNEPNTSHVLKAMNYSDEAGRGVIRISFSNNAETTDYNNIFEALKHIYKKLAPIGHH